MDIDLEIAQYNVSRETVMKLKHFVVLLTEWNERMNLVSKNSLKDVWLRHVLDSLQLISYIPQTTQTLVDIGSGAGFPAVVLAIIMQEKLPTAKIYLVESISKKTLYLKDVCQRLELNNVEVVNLRIEKSDIKKADVITARAVASLEVLCDYVYKLSKKNTLALFLKGKTYADEIALSNKKWQFALQVFKNKYSSDGVVLAIQNVRIKSR